MYCTPEMYSTRSWGELTCIVVFNWTAVSGYPKPYNHTNSTFPYQALTWTYANIGAYAYTMWPMKSAILYCYGIGVPIASRCKQYEANIPWFATTVHALAHTRRYVHTCVLQRKNTPYMVHIQLYTPMWCTTRALCKQYHLCFWVCFTSMCDA